MNKKYHISNDGIPRVCRAKEGNCKLGAHFNSYEEAAKYSDYLNEQNYKKSKRPKEITPDYVAQQKYEEFSNEERLERALHYREEDYQQREKELKNIFQERNSILKKTLYIDEKDKQKYEELSNKAFQIMVDQSLAINDYGVRAKIEMESKRKYNKIKGKNREKDGYKIFEYIRYKELLGKEKTEFYKKILEEKGFANEYAKYSNQSIGKRFITYLTNKIQD